MKMKQSMLIKVLAVAAVQIFFCSALNEGDRDAQDLIAFLSKPRLLDRYRPESFPMKVVSFSWHNCGGNDPVVIHSLTVNPDPIRLSGNISLAFNVSANIDITAPVRVELKVEKKIGFWIEIPCIDNLGSCTYSDICSLLPKQPCPPEFGKYGLPCHCPSKKGNYALPGFSMKLPSVNVPSFLSDGDFKATAHVYADNQRIACYEIETSITK